MKRLIIGIMEKKTETAIVPYITLYYPYWGCIGIMGKENGNY